MRWPKARAKKFGNDAGNCCSGKPVAKTMRDPVINDRNGADTLLSQSRQHSGRTDTNKKSNSKREFKNTFLCFHVFGLGRLNGCPFFVLFLENHISLMVSVFPIVFLTNKTENPTYVIQINNKISASEWVKVGREVQFVRPTSDMGFDLGVDNSMPIYQRCFCQAENHWRASVSIEGDQSMIIPYIVLRSFAVELYYKTIVYHQNAGKLKKMIHEIEDLHGQVPESLATCIQGIFEGLVNIYQKPPISHEELQKAFAFKLERELIPDEMKYFREICESSWHHHIKSLHDLLKILNRAFVDTRYSFENCNPTDLPLATRALRLACLTVIGQFWKQDYLLMP